MRNKILIVTPKLNLSGGVSVYWSAILPLLNNSEYEITIFEIGGHGKNILSALYEQYRFSFLLKDQYSLVLLNPSLKSKSFIRDGLFSIQLDQKNIPFILFFHGWNRSFEKIIDKVLKKVFLKTFAKAKRILVLSPEFLEKIRNWGYNDHISIVSTCFDQRMIQNEFINSKIFDGIKTVKILFLARMIKEKGIYETIEAFNDLCIDFNNIELYVAGEGPDFKFVKELISGNERIYLLGNVTGVKKIELMKKCHIFVFPTYYGEGLPTTILEAMAFGLPVITTAVGGIKNIFENEKMGYLVEEQNVFDLKRTIKKLILNKDMLYSISRFNHQYAKKYFASDIIVSQLKRNIDTELEKLGR